MREWRPPVSAHFYRAGRARALGAGKDDRRDALKAARLSAVNQLREVYIPQTEIRQWRALLTYRQHLVGRRTKIKNHIRDLLVREGQLLPRGSRCWNKLGQEQLNGMARPLAEVGPRSYGALSYGKSCSSCK